MSVALNIGLDPLTSDWPRLATVVANATVLVVSLTWVLLPALYWATGGWAAPHPTPSADLAEPGRDVADVLSP